MPPRCITYSRIVHLSHVIAPGMPQWPGDPPLELDVVAERATHGYFLRRVALGEHSATHLNAPASFHDGGDAVDAYEPTALVVPAALLDVRAAAAADADFLAAPSDLTAWERVHGPVPADSVVLLHTGWASRWGDAAAFLNADADGALHFPGFSRELAALLIEERRVAGVGIDTHGVDGGCEQGLAVNSLVLERRRLVLECLANLDQLPAMGATLAIGVLRLRGGSGSPAAVLAFLP
jgi:kynurenine formamidase